MDSKFQISLARVQPSKNHSTSSFVEGARIVAGQWNRKEKVLPRGVNQNSSSFGWLMMNLSSTPVTSRKRNSLFSFAESHKVRIAISHSLGLISAPLFLTSARSFFAKDDLRTRYVGARLE